MRRVWIVAALLLLGACGRAHGLAPVKGEALPPKPYGAVTPPHAAALLAPSAQARPKRGDDVLTGSQDRRSDEFELPPR